MNYSRNIRRSQIAKRVIASWVAIAVVMCLIGVLIGHMTTRANQKGVDPINTPIPTEAPEMVLYGAYDDRIIDSEPPVDDWEYDKDFQPLGVELDADVQQFIFYLCKEYDIDFTLVMAIIEWESGYQADCISATHDYGLMGINVVNHDWLSNRLGVTDFLDPYQNVRAGMFILRKLFEKYQDVNLVLMAYNKGEHGAALLWDQGIYEIHYTQQIFRIQSRLDEEVWGGLTNERTVESN